MFALSKFTQPEASYAAGPQEGLKIRGGINKNPRHYDGKGIYIHAKISKGGKLPPCNPFSDGPVLLDTLGSDKVSDNELLHPKFFRKNNALANHFFADLLVYILFSNYILILCTYTLFCSFNFLFSCLFCLIKIIYTTGVR